jgi:hypothetical protein
MKDPFQEKKLWNKVTDLIKKYLFLSLITVFIIGILFSRFSCCPKKCPSRPPDTICCYELKRIYGLSQKMEDSIKELDEKMSLAENKVIELTSQSNGDSLEIAKWKKAYFMTAIQRDSLMIYRDSLRIYIALNHEKVIALIKKDYDINKIQKQKDSLQKIMEEKFPKIAELTAKNIELKNEIDKIHVFYSYFIDRKTEKYFIKGKTETFHKRELKKLKLAFSIARISSLFEDNVKPDVILFRMPNYPVRDAKQVLKVDDIYTLIFGDLRSLVSGTYKVKIQFGEKEVILDSYEFRISD